jgi:sialate O-acetylesterase
VKLRISILSLSALLALAASAAEFARPFADSMILPHGRPIPVWGSGQPGEVVTVAFADQSQIARCGPDGRWQLTLTAEKPSASGRELVVSSIHGRVALKDVLIGEVWLASGQSNMDFPLGRAVGGKAAAAEAGNFPAIRLLNLTGAPTDTRVYSPEILARLTPHDHFTGNWAIASEASAGEISAIAWWTAKAIHLAKGIPIGVVENAVGGSGAEAWLSPEILKSRADYRPLLDDGWLESPQVSAWARGRAKLNLGNQPTANHPFRPGFLFESGVQEWSRFPFTGVLWYQGETNAELADERWNERMIQDLITSWRAAFKRPDLPFFMVQLPRIGGNDPLRAHWPEFRKVQARIAKRIPGVHLIVTEDLGWDSPDVHPPDKLPVATRLADEVIRAKLRPN